MNDSLMILMQESQKIIAVNFMKGFLYYLVIPITAIVVGGLILQYILTRKSFKEILRGIKLEIQKKADLEKVNESIARAHKERELGDVKLHERIDRHIGVLAKVESNVAYIRGKIDTFLHMENR